MILITREFCELYFQFINSLIAQNKWLLGELNSLTIMVEAQFQINVQKKVTPEMKIITFISRARLPRMDGESSI